MWSAPVYVLRYGFCVLVMCLALGGAFASLAADPPAQSVPPKPNDPATQAATPGPQIDRMEPTAVARGNGVTFTGQNFPTKDNITIYFNNELKGQASWVSEDKKTFIFAVPSNVNLGTYTVRIDIKQGDNPVPFAIKLPEDARLTIYSEAGNIPPKISSISPLISYPEKKVYGFDIFGEGFSPKGPPTDNGLLIENQEIRDICWGAGCDENKLRAIVSEDGRQLTVKGLSTNQDGIMNVRLRVGDRYSPPFPLTLSRVGRSTPMFYSLLIVAALFGIIFVLTRKGIGVSEIAGKRFGILTSLFLDPETDTYSLSRFQFFLWTAVAILAYLYLMLSRSLVQGKLEFVDVPEGLPAIILISASTTVLALGVNNSKGPKGAGEIHPSLADFISVGGMVVPERFQFFVWTLLGAIVFLFLVMLNDPRTISDLPKVPSGFLELMGISSLGYLGGKLARKPGPVIDEISPKISSLELTIRGRVLSQDAGFQIGNDQIGNDTLIADNIEGGKPKISEPDTQTSEPNMAKVLVLTIKNPKPEWLQGNNRLTIINPDGQKATWAYTFPLTIDSADVQNVNGQLTITVKGKNFGQDSQVTLQTEDGKPWPGDQPKATFTAPDTWVINTSPAQSGIVTITNPDKKSVSTPFKVSV